MVIILFALVHILESQHVVLCSKLSSKLTFAKIYLMAGLRIFKIQRWKFLVFVTILRCNFTPFQTAADELSPLTVDEDGGRILLVEAGLGHVCTAQNLLPALKHLFSKSRIRDGIARTRWNRPHVSTHTRLCECDIARWLRSWNRLRRGFVANGEED